MVAGGGRGVEECARGPTAELTRAADTPCRRVGAVLAVVVTGCSAGDGRDGMAEEAAQGSGKHR
jgi:hypothetical protein